MIRYLGKLNKLASSPTFGTTRALPVNALIRLYHSDGSDQLGKLIYRARLTNRVRILKIFSMVSSAITSGVYGYAFIQKGFTTTVAVSGVIFVPFIFTPIIISLFFRRYVNAMYYNPKTETYTIRHYGFFLRSHNNKFKKEDVKSSQITDVTSNFTVRGVPFFIHEEDLLDAESVALYKEMILPRSKK